MKYLIATDLHGSEYYAKKIIDLFKSEKCDRLILLGDLYYHGPRNPLPKDYAPLEVANLLNAIADKLIVIKGNCDASVDEMISEFVFSPMAEIVFEDRKVYCTHGDLFNKDNIPKLKSGDLLIYGHFHKNEIIEKDGVICVNIASPSLPKEGCPPSYALLCAEGVLIKDFDNNKVYQYKF